MQKEFREQGIYRLPDGREFVVCSDERDQYVLFTPEAWEDEEGAPEYRINTEGKLLSRGIPTRWSVDDLTDTGRTAE